MQFLLWLGFIALALSALNGLVWLLILLSSVFVLLDLLLNPAWTSWMGDIVNEKERASFFGKRNEISGFAAVSSSIIAGWILGFFENLSLGLAGFALLFAIAFIARGTSIYYLRKKIEPRFEEHADGKGF